MFQSTDCRAEHTAGASVLFRLFLVVALFCTALTSSLAAQARPSTPAQLHGPITTQNGAVFPPGLGVTITDTRSGKPVAETTSDQTGKYEVPNPPPRHLHGSRLPRRIRRNAETVGSGHCRSPE